MEPKDVVALVFNEAQLDYLAESIASRLRTKLNEPSAPLIPPNVDYVSTGSLMIDFRGFDAINRGISLNLKPQEFRLLEALARNMGQVLSREHLLDLAWPLDRRERIDDRTVDIHVRRIRAKLDNDSYLIKTVSGIGYKLIFDSRKAS